MLICKVPLLKKNKYVDIICHHWFNLKKGVNRTGFKLITLFFLVQDE